MSKRLRLCLTFITGALVAGMLVAGASACGKNASGPLATQTAITKIVTVIVTVTPQPTPLPTMALAPPPTEPPTPPTVATAPPRRTPSATPTPLAAPDTPPGTILEVGQTWRQDGLELNLSSVEIHTSGIRLNFGLTSRRMGTTVFRFIQGDTFNAADNRGMRFPVNDADYVYQFTLDPNQGTGLSPGCCDIVFLQGDTTSSATSVIVVTVSGISSITNAKWRIPIQH